MMGKLYRMTEKEDQIIVQRDCPVRGNIRIRRQSNDHLLQTKVIGHHLAHMNNPIEFRSTTWMSKPIKILLLVNIHIFSLWSLVIFSEAIKNMSKIISF